MPIIVALIALAHSASAIEVTTSAGQLSSQLTDTSVSSLTVVGEMDARDFQYIATTLSSLTELDLSGVTIAAYCDANHPVAGAVYDYAAGTLPQGLLMGMKLEHIVLPESLVAIGQAALAGCDRLTSIALPASLRTIGDYAFSGSGLEHIVIPSTVTHVGRGAFAHCFALASAEVGAAEIGACAFLGNDHLSALSLGAGVQCIGDEAFHGTAIQSLDASGLTALTHLGSWAAASTPLASASLPAGTTSMGEGAFFGTTQLGAVSLPTSLHAIPDYAFAGGSVIASDTLLHDGIDSIGAYAFYNWGATSYFYLPATVAYLGSRAMAGMTALEQLDAMAATPPALGDSVWAGVDQPSVKLVTADNTAAALYGAAEQWQDFYIAQDFLPGDVNGDGVVDVSDINQIIALMLGNDPDPFIFAAADIDGNGVIDVSDINGIVNIIMGTSAKSMSHRLQSNSTDWLTTDDVLTIDPLSIGAGETRTIEVRLSGSQDYEGVQFDIVLPSCLELVSGSLSATARTAGHALHQRTSGSTTRVLSYSQRCQPIATGDDALLTLRVRATDDIPSDAVIMLDNIVLSHAGRSYHAPCGTTLVDSTTGIDNLTATADRVYAAGQTIVIEASESCTAQVVDLGGRVRTLDVVAGHNECTGLSSGIYIVRLHGMSHKVLLP